MIIQGAEILVTQIRGLRQSAESRALIGDQSGSCAFDAAADAISETVQDIGERKPCFLSAVAAEHAEATAKWPELNSLHEGYAVLAEEVDELWDHVREKESKRDWSAIRVECVQIATVAMRIAAELAEINIEAEQQQDVSELTLEDVYEEERPFETNEVRECLYLVFGNDGPGDGLRNDDRDHVWHILEEWSQEERDEALTWANACYANAGDDDSVDIPPRPACMQQLDRFMTRPPEPPSGGHDE